MRSCFSTWTVHQISPGEALEEPMLAGQPQRVWSSRSGMWPWPEHYLKKFSYESRGCSCENRTHSYRRKSKIENLRLLSTRKPGFHHDPLCLTDILGWGKGRLAQIKHLFENWPCACSAACSWIQSVTVNTLLLLVKLSTFQFLSGSLVPS